MKNYILFLIYAIGKDQFDFWRRMPYDEAFVEVQKCHDEYKSYTKGSQEQNEETKVYGYLRHGISESINI